MSAIKNSTFQTIQPNVGFNQILDIQPTTMISHATRINDSNMQGVLRCNSQGFDEKSMYSSAITRYA